MRQRLGGAGLEVVVGAGAMCATAMLRWMCDSRFVGS
jgi:hypothetical protein